MAFLVIGLALPRSIVAQVVVNEVSPASTPEWVELYNFSESEVSLSGCTLYFDDNHSIQNASLADQTVPAKSYLVHENSKSLLNNKGDELSLVCSWGSDTLAYGDQNGARVSAPKKTQSLARIPDGSGEFEVVDDPSKSSPNPQAVQESQPEQTEVLVKQESARSVDEETPVASQVTVGEIDKVKTVSQPTPVISRKPTKTAEKIEVLGLQQVEPTVYTPTVQISPEDEKQEVKSLPVFAAALILVGGVFIGIAGYMIIREFKIFRRGNNLQ